MKAGMAILAALCLFLGVYPLSLLNIIDKVSYEVTKVSIINSISGTSSVVYYPINNLITMGNSSISPLFVLFLFLLIFVLIFFIIKRFCAKTSSREYITWDCGFDKLSPSMQYTSTGFSKPLRIVFRMLYRPSRVYHIENGDSHFPVSSNYSTNIENLVEKYFYLPILSFVLKISKKMKYTIQAGSVHIYLLYIFIALLAVMIYNALV
jgi:hypothetical protein